MHIVLLGDSVFDNAAYTSGGKAVIDHLSGLLGPDERATLLAVDGHCVEDVPSQIPLLPDDVSHVVVSVGGNDALQHQDLLREPATMMGLGLAVLGQAVDRFEERYRRMLAELTPHAPWLQICTVYNGDFGVEAPAISAAVRLFDDAIQRVAAERAAPVLELRSLLDQPVHYANPIEPSVEGGRVLAEEILKRVRA